LQQGGEFAAGLTELRRGHELGSQQPGWKYPSAEWVGEAERLASVEGRLPAFVAGEDHPRDRDEWRAALFVIQAKGLHRVAARLAITAFAADPALADDLNVGLRYNAACVAALAAAGRGDGAQADAAERGRLRGQALAWLRADLAAWAWAAADGAARPTVSKGLRYWQQDADLAGVRGDALSALPESERADWQKLWADVAALLRQVGGP
jgi:hypothetical protein